MGYIFTARAMGYLTGALISGRMFDSKAIPAHYALAVALLATGVGNAIVPMTSNIIVVAAVSTAGIGMGFLDTGGNVLLIRLHGSNVGPYMQAMHFSFALGTPHRRGGQLTGGGCMPAESRGGQRGVGGGKETVDLGEARSLLASSRRFTTNP
jgi:hypothetical protein